MIFASTPAEIKKKWKHDNEKTELKNSTMYYARCT